MKHKIIKIFIGAACIISLWSCVKVLDYDIPDDEKRIVVNGILFSDSSFNVHINKSLHVLDRIGIKAIDNALVQLYDGDLLVSEINTGNAGLYVSDYIPVSGHEYLLMVTVAGMNTASARCIVPLPVPIITVDTTITVSEYTGFYYYSTTEMQCAIRFNDPAETENFYELIGTVNYRDNSYSEFVDDTTKIFSPRWINSNVTLKSNDPIIEQWITGKNIYLNTNENNYSYGERVIFSDRLIDGQNYKLNIGLVSPYLSYISDYIDSIKVDIHLRSITRDYYVYLQLLEKHLKVKDDPFSEPSQAYTNINNGLGVLAGFSESIYSIYINKPANR